MPTVELLCLANSIREGQRCVAGTTASGEWIRPVSTLTGGSIPVATCRLDTGHDTAVLDVIQIPLGAPQPEPGQPENRLLEDGTWTFRSHLTDAQALAVLRPRLTRGPELFGNRADRVRYADLLASPATSSLAVIAPSDVRWNITTSMRGNRQTRALFTLDGSQYNLSITDPVWQGRLQHLDTGLHRLEEAGLDGAETLLFTLSLGGQFQGDCYKLVAAVMALR